jgi:autophagy-related protein 2
MVTVRSEIAPLTGVKTQSVTCKIPSVQAKIRQPTVEGLQFFADDMTHWLDGAFGDGSAPRPRDDLKMIGSRFFGSKASSSASSSGDYDDEDDFGSATLFRLAVSEVEVALLVPKVKGVAESSAASERIVSLRASDMDVKLESNSTNKQETSVTLTAMDADLFHMSEPGSEPHRLFGRTTPLNYSTHTQPLMNLRFSSITHEDRTKETIIKMTTNACTVYVTKDLEWVHDLALYAKTPEGVFEDVVPSEVTRIQMSVYDCSVHVSAPTMPGALLAVMTAVEVRATMESESDENTTDLGVSGFYILAIDDRESAAPLQHHPKSLEAWKRAGYAQLVELVGLDGQVVRSNVPQSTLLDIQHCQLRVTACADSFATLGALAGDLSKLSPAPPASPAPRKRTMALDQSIDVFASVDLDAFGKAPDVISGADMIDDDLPTNLDYLDHAAGAKAPAIDRHTGESLRSWETPDDAPHIQNDLGGGTIKVLMPEPFDEQPDYWNTLPVLKGGVQ